MSKQGFWYMIDWGQSTKMDVGSIRKLMNSSKREPTLNTNRTPERHILQEPEKRRD
jgi:hypothetical protein